MKSTREQILEYLRTHPLARVSEMAAALQMTPANVRHHLALLQASGLVEIAQVAPPRGRGRPANLFRLTKRAQQGHLEPLTRAVLDLLREQGGMEKHFPTLCRRLCSGFEVPFQGNLRQRLQQLMRLLEGLHYEPRWEARVHGPHIILNRCPFAPLRDEYPELCRLDHLLLEQALGYPVTPLSKADEIPTDGGPAVCRYAVQRS